ncbi:MAG: hypothetical protein MUQ55_05740 [Paracoccaceae bacterium]|jgi:hypothetical protein|nr:hypothetical protein [Paracoccaceae bacterium]MDO7633266.1 hypothetical protein [Paracoccaceae bacterium]MDO7655433.1 hypothetical protein [Paracoccaceae bacterium]MDO7659286.1 hypothetical protein [Paracoccaceae bacterium]MDO7733001.1 hypothetical protein [Paracoccaceae bacterium]
MGFDQNTALVAYDDPLALLSLGVEGGALWRLWWRPTARLTAPLAL